MSAFFIPIAALNIQQVCCLQAAWLLPFSFRGNGDFARMEKRKIPLLKRVRGAG